MAVATKTGIMRHGSRRVWIGALAQSLFMHGYNGGLVHERMACGTSGSGEDGMQDRGIIANRTPPHGIIARHQLLSSIGHDQFNGFRPVC